MRERLRMEALDSRLRGNDGSLPFPHLPLRSLHPLLVIPAEAGIQSARISSPPNHKETLA